MQSSPHDNIFEVSRHLKDRRFDAVLFELLKQKYPENKALSRGFSATLIKEGKAELNGEKTKPSAIVSFQDSIRVADDIFSVEEKKNFSQTDVTLKKLYEDENILVLDKPGNITMHVTQTSAEYTVVHWLLEQYPEIKNVGDDPLRPGLVHRLDRETSGVLVVAKTQESFIELKKIFQERNIEKTYIALVYGNLSSREGKIDTSLTRLSGELKRKAVDIKNTSAKLSGNVRTALTYYRVIVRYKDFDLVEVRPKTGRTHQIRVHFSSIGHPVVGDKLYAFKPAKRGEMFFSDRHLLHAWQLSFTLFGKKHTFLAPMPADFRGVFQSLDGSQDAGYDDEALKSLFSE